MKHEEHEFDQALPSSARGRGWLDEVEPGEGPHPALAEASATFSRKREKDSLPALRRGLLRAMRYACRRGSFALDLVFPPSCLVCRRAVEDHGALCASCWSDIAFIERPFCERSGAPFDRDLGGGGLISLQASADPPVFGRARAVARYDGEKARGLAHRLKYHDRQELAEPLGRWMARAGAELLTEADLLVPVPLHRRRLFARRFNQAAALAKVVSRESAVPAEMLALERVKPTAPQVGLTRAQRAVNMQGAFRVREDKSIAVAGMNIVLVDDVMTSGATVNAAARTLLRAKAARVDVLVFALVVTGA